MAILRGGKRIGGMDIRIGIPRDRSMDNINRDPRFKQKAGANPATTIGRFQAYVNEAEGFARKSKYYVIFDLPRGPLQEVGSDGMVKGAEFRKYANEANLQRRVQAFVQSVSMPERTMKVKKVKHNGPARNIVYDYEMADVNMTFLTDKYARERIMFEMWQKTSFSNMTHNFSYYDEYVAPINILQLGSSPAVQERDEATYGVRLWEAYPTKVGELSYAAETSEVQTFEVTFTYRYWLNFALDQQNKFHIGQSEFAQPVIKQGDPGFLGGILNKLPPELRRAGRGVLEDLKRSFPIGKITGGRVMPPFKFPPLNI
tara:strand:+ start:1000 stop:1944 length:945 start_codon:yes stop_codon:yes gene_type:complete